MADQKIFGNYGPSDPDLKRSTYDLSYTNNLSCRPGPIYPVLVDLLCPNSTAMIQEHFAFDVMPMLSPIQTTMRCHITYFKVPLRIIWNHNNAYEDFFKRIGNHVIPFIDRQDYWHPTGSLADYMGLPSQNFLPINDISSLTFIPMGFSVRVNNPSNIKGAIIPTSYKVYDTAGYGSNLFYSVPYYTSNESFVWMSDSLPGSSSDGIFSMLYVGNGTGSNYTLQIQAVRLIKNSSLSNYAVVDSVDPINIDFLSSTVSDYPYSNLQPGTACFSSSRVLVYRGQSTTVRDLVFRLPSSFVTSLNSLISDGDVRLLISYSSLSYSGVYSFFGVPSNELNQLSLVQPSVPSFSTPLTQEEGESVKQINLLNSLVLSSRNLQGFGRYHLVSYTADPSKEFISPFASRLVQDEILPPKIPIDAFAFRAYEFIYNYYFRNERIDPFVIDGVPTYSKYITNDGDGADSTTPVDFKYAPYEKDLFTSAVKTPQWGPAPLVGITTNDNDASTGTLNMVDPVSGKDYNIAVLLGDSGRIVGIGNYDEVADKTSVTRLSEAINFGISINDLRNVSALQAFNERMLKAGFHYEDLVQEFFGVRPPVGENHPERLGGITRVVNIGKIQNTAMSSDFSLGEFGGVGSCDGHSEVIECFTKEWCILMGLMYFTCTPVYSQKLDKHFMYRNYFDFYNPVFAGIGAQPIYKKQLAPLQLSDEELDDVWGYGVPWSEMISRQDEAHGQFRSSMYHYLLQRSFVNPPELGHNFITIDPKDLTNIYANTLDDDKIFGAIRHEYLVEMPKPRIWVPHIVG